MPDLAQSSANPTQAPELAQLQTLAQLQHDVLDALPVAITVFEVVSDSQIRMVMGNRAMFVIRPDLPNLIGRPIEDLLVPAEAARTYARLQPCIHSGETIEIEDSFTLPQGTVWSQSTYLPIRNDQGRTSHIVILTRDVTAQKQREQAEQYQQEIIQQQAAALAELSTPLLAISDTTVVMPLVGAVDSRRIQQLMEVLLTGVAERQARTVILDITGVPIVDTQVASALIQASQAVGLLGARVILTGIRPEVAQTLVGLGVDLGTITTRGTLQNAISYALTTGESSS